MFDHRPFIEWPLEQLAEHVRNHAGHAEVLARVQHELTCRRGKEARALLRRLEPLLPPGEAARWTPPPQGDAGRGHASSANDAGRWASSAPGDAGRWTPGTPGEQTEAALRRRLAEALMEVQELRQRVAASGNGEAQAPATPHAEVHLQPDAPEWLIIAARRAFRRHYHPDRHAGLEQAAAEARFKEAEEAFAKILGSEKH